MPDELLMLLIVPVDNYNRGEGRATEKGRNREASLVTRSWAQSRPNWLPVCMNAACSLQFHKDNTTDRHSVPAKDLLSGYVLSACKSIMLASGKSNVNRENRQIAGEETHIRYNAAIKRWAM